MPSSVKTIYLVLPEFFKQLSKQFRTHSHQFSFLKRNKTTHCKQCQDSYSFLLKNKLVGILSSSPDILYYPFLELLHYNSAVFSLRNCPAKTPLCWRESCHDHRHRHVEFLTYRQVFPFKMQESTKCRGSGFINQHGKLLGKCKEMCQEYLYNKLILTLHFTLKTA